MIGLLLRLLLDTAGGISGPLLLAVRLVSIRLAFRGCSVLHSLCLILLLSSFSGSGNKSRSRHNGLVRPSGLLILA